MNDKNQRVIVLIMRVLAMAMAAVSLALVLIETAEPAVHAVVLALGLFALAAAAIVEPQQSAQEYDELDP